MRADRAETCEGDGMRLTNGPGGASDWCAIQRIAVPLFLQLNILFLPVAQLDSASDSDSEGPRFESARVGQKITLASFDVSVIFLFIPRFDACVANAVRISRISRSEAKLSARVGQK